MMMLNGNGGGGGGGGGREKNYLSILKRKAEQYDRMARGEEDTGE